ncbi:MAG: hypothetical protein LBQ30_00785 [Treponema sp.]|jgi:hypothetical protein|nr:hypothetical protein [Treponema sp.]
MNRIRIMGIAAVAAVTVTVGCAFGGGGKEDDPHTPLVNPFIGSWQAGDGVYWVFREDGTGGTGSALSEVGDDYSYLIWYGQGLGTNVKHNTLVTAGGDTNSAASAEIKQYRFAVNSATITLIPQILTLGTNDYYTIQDDTAHPITLTRQGAAVEKPLSLSNDLIGEWHADWDGEHNTDGNTTWSYKFRTDGTARTYHHAMHQFDNGYLLRGKVLVILGEWRFSDTFGYTASTVTPVVNGRFTAQEHHHGALNWDFQHVASAEWK